MNTPHLHIPSPCHESWEGMAPLPHGRHCATCDHAVVDVTSMPVAEGRRFLHKLTTTAHQDSVRRTCVRAHSTPSGQLVVGRRKLLTHALATMLACTMAGCVGDGPDLVNAQTPESQQQTHHAPLSEMVAPQPQPSANVIMGEICEPIMGKFAAPGQPTPKKDTITIPPDPTSENAAH